MAETYDVGTRAWQPDATEGWVASEVVKKTVQGAKVVLQFKLENGEVSHPENTGPVHPGCSVDPFVVKNGRGLGRGSSERR